MNSLARPRPRERIVHPRARVEPRDDQHATSLQGSCATFDRVAANARVLCQKFPVRATAARQSFISRHQADSGHFAGMRSPVMFNAATMYGMLCETS
jgi:hypothetical protein